MRPGPIGDFWPKVHFGPDCWEWMASKEESGYGVAWHDGKKIGAHRLSVLLSGRKIPPGMFACHRCDNPPCVRPDHLFVGTRQDNEDDCTRKGRRSHAGGAHLRTRTHCPSGHPYDSENTSNRPPSKTQKTHRVCKACARAYWHRKKGLRQ